MPTSFLRLPASPRAAQVREADIMRRPPRRADLDPLVDWRLLNYAYLHLGVLQCLAGFFAFWVTLNDFGYSPGAMLGTGVNWWATCGGPGVWGGG